jgi:hypothetical protein
MFLSLIVTRFILGHFLDYYTIPPVAEKCSRRATPAKRHQRKLVASSP